MLGRFGSILLIALSLVFNVFAVTALFDAWEVADTAWKAPFYKLGGLYLGVVTPVANLLTEPVSNLFRMELPCWWIHLLAVYAASSLAIYAGAPSHNEDKSRVSLLKRGGISALWPTAAVGMIAQGFRNRVVTRFLRRHTFTGLFYLVAVLGLYGAANWANINLIGGAPVPGQEVKIRNDVRCPVSLPPADVIRDELGNRLREEGWRFIPGS
ncbi:MAG: hypothetical protein V2I43_14755 [Parvularcula sp.]|jgi:hypothetical protein|nr:hypothetical protein [Parvularcula sp.]